MDDGLVVEVGVAVDVQVEDARESAVVVEVRYGCGLVDLVELDRGFVPAGFLSRDVVPRRVP